jgi:hypothetical protein
MFRVACTLTEGLCQQQEHHLMGAGGVFAGSNWVFLEFAMHAIVLAGVFTGMPSLNVDFEAMKKRESSGIH